MAVFMFRYMRNFACICYNSTIILLLLDTQDEQRLMNCWDGSIFGHTWMKMLRDMLKTVIYVKDHESPDMLHMERSSHSPYHNSPGKNSLWIL